MAFLSVGFATAVMIGAACAQAEPASELALPPAATPSPAPEEVLACTSAYYGYGAQVVDDETGATVKGAYWRSETLDGVIFLELEEGGDHEGYILAGDSGVIYERVIKAAMATMDAAKRDYGSASEDFRVVVAKEGYVTIVRQLTATGDACHIRDVEGDREFRLVKGPPGEDAVFRQGR